MNALLFDSVNQTFTVVDVKDFHDYNKFLNCSCIDVCRRKIGGQTFEIVLDDEGLLKDNPILSAINPFDRENCLVGNLLFYHGLDFEGDFTPITDEDVKIIESNVMTAKFTDGSVKKVIEIDW